MSPANTRLIAGHTTTMANSTCKPAVVCTDQQVVPISTVVNLNKYQSPAVLAPTKELNLQNDLSQSSTKAVAPLEGDDKRRQQQNKCTKKSISSNNKMSKQLPSKQSCGEKNAYSASSDNKPQQPSKDCFSTPKLVTSQSALAKEKLNKLYKQLANYSVAQVCL